MAVSSAFRQLASGAIEDEIRTYFPDTALYRRLCWGGFDGCNKLIHREFSPDQETASIHEATLANSSLGPANGRAALSCPHARHSTPSLRASRPLKRRRIGIVEELERGLRSMDAVHSTEGGLPGTLQAQKQPDISQASLQSPSTANASISSTLKNAPFAVRCVGCTTRVTSAYRCAVIKGYVVLWAESVLAVSCMPTAHHGSEAETDTVPPPTSKEASRTVKEKRKECIGEPRRSVDNAEGLLPLIGLRPLLHRFTTAFTPAPRLISALADVLVREDAKRQKVEGRKSSGGHEVSEQRACTTQQLTLHTLHIVNDDAVTHLRPASFALQSVLQPGLPTVLECYPRHMVHFGLLCFAAWRAKPDMWRELMGGVDEHASLTTTDAKGCVTNKKKATHSLASLVPHKADDAVLILGLGGNVLGECLDAVLPTAVPLHIVEVEPAVLQACEEHNQFPQWRPPSAALNGGEEPGRRLNGTTTKEEAASAKPAKRQLQATLLHTWREVTALSHKRSSQPVVFSSIRQCNCNAGAVKVCDDSTNQRLNAKGLATGGGASPLIDTKGSAEASSRYPGALRTSVSTCSEQRGEYLCFLQDAYAFLRQSSHVNAAQKSIHSTFVVSLNRVRGAGTRGVWAKAAALRDVPLRASLSSSVSVSGQGKKEEAPPGETLSRCGAQVSVPAVAALATVQYSIIFLDCYDPDREHMMHEGGLIDLCARRLRPGGVLLVNAHVLPTVANLERDFLTHGFATVQALRVSGCTQTVLVCIWPDAEEDQSASKERWKEKCARFTVHQLQLLAHRLNMGGIPPPQSSHGASRQDLPSISSALLRSGFLLDASWLKACRRMPTVRRAGGEEEEVDFRVWLHHF
ncbi:hypothetical protein ABL78_1426 [Leptomonas seymouri]|uniref:Uncharacterized protein n=1 Tax=Leptomonas seymouri TaxID=5684 RepID=A0A0N1PEZ4_LEPSE|nr:hypothetical protein ABL78_1426 [Leptomonas seymouri]|eukprot:KPI89462.1 hypothetical protein ABL78_1426 [Leptomonas seymouri]